MQLRTIATFAVAIVLGLIAVILVRNTLNSSATTQSLNTVPVVVTAQAIPRDSQLQATMFKVVSYPRDGVPAGSFHSIQDLMASGGGNRTAQRNLAANEVILAENATGTSESSTLSRTLEAGMRAVSMRTNDVAGVAGFIVPGDRIDVLATHGSSTRADSTVTESLAQNLRVLAVDQTSSVDATRPNVAKAITVEATPHQAAAISLAQSVGSLTLVLRKPRDGTEIPGSAISVSTSSPSGADMARAVPRPAPAVTPAPAPPVAPVARPQVHVIRGVDSTSYPAAGS